MIQNAKQRILSLQGKVVLGLSGGPDSMCLYHLLLECKKEFVVAHVDHGLREESAREKVELQQKAAADGIPFYATRLEVERRANLEEVLREERMAFFQQVLEEEGSGTLLLGHQKDERAETVIKRFFEGGSLSTLPALRESTFFRGVEVVRPLLATTKKEVIAYLEKRGMVFFTDPTNVGEGNLRARMRSGLIPVLERAFGKNVVHSVCDRADQISAVDAFVEREVEKLYGREEVGAFGVFFPGEEGVDPFLFLEWIARHLKKEGQLFSRVHKAAAEEYIREGNFGKKIELSTKNLFVEREGVFVLEKDAMPLGGRWEEGESWRELWRRSKNTLPSKARAAIVLDRKKSSEWHRNHQTPICLRSLFPIKEI